MPSCPAIPIDGNGGLAGALTAIDCQLGAVVQAGYGRIFGDAGGLALALRGLLVIWVALLALGLIGGHLRARAMGPRLFGCVLVLTFATAWPAYQTVVYGLLVGGPGQIASGLLGGSHGATQLFAARLDRLFGSLVELGRVFDAQGDDASAALKLASRLVWGSALSLLFSTVGLLVVARIVLALLLALGPVFIAFGLFRGTRGLCEGWLRMALAFALLPMLVTLSGAALLRVLDPLIDAIAQDPLAAAEQQKPLMMLSLGCGIYLGLLLALAWTAAGIVRGWRFARAGSASPAAAAPSAWSPAAVHAPGHVARAAVVQAQLHAPDAARVAVQVRTADPARLPSIAPSPPAVLAATSPPPRRSGLGQRLRPKAPATPLTPRAR
ncbi:type IV secretion system protein [Pseudoxanthomonas sp.]|uniref:type IV secretion system protein n=1 Tax=Pseudoxanthomonas sp. TaxID=1871049 RepID=UPI00261C77F9|nr:type IV secretion system protein [Pseudoxanthomonas sp.]WDS35482.1 MAG: type IV secretion system protein [Pseudoxanthomonas sp.]